MTAARVYLNVPLAAGGALDLPADQARHVQVLRLQPGDALVLFNGQGGEWQASIGRIGRRQVAVRVLRHLAVERELPWSVTLALGMPANERMDALVEKATELGAAIIQPLRCARAVLKLEGDRAVKRQAHWQAVATAAAEQSGRTRLPQVAPVQTVAGWLAQPEPLLPPCRAVLSLAPDAQPWRLWLEHGVGQRVGQMARSAVCLLSGPEGGLTAQEEAAARQHGFAPVSLGERVLRADTAPLAALAALALHGGA